MGTHQTMSYTPNRMTSLPLLTQTLHPAWEIVSTQKRLLIELYYRITDLNPTHYQNFPDKIIIKSE